MVYLYLCPACERGDHEHCEIGDPAPPGVCGGSKCKCMDPSHRVTARPDERSADAIIADLEARGLGWSLDNTGNLVEARVWNWPYVIGRYRPNATEPLAHMLRKAMEGIDLAQYPMKNEKPGG